jgi:putative transposase
MKLVVNEKVFYQGEEYVIHKLKDSTEIFIRNPFTSPKPVKISELQDQPSTITTVDPYERPIESYSEKNQEKARKRLAIIQPFLGELRGNKKVLVQIAKANNLNVSTLYNWISKFDQYGHIGCLVDSEQKGGTGKGRLEKDIEQQMATIIDEVYLESKSVNRTYMVLAERCKDLGFILPHINTLRRRIKQISDYKRISRRVSPRAAGLKYDLKTGTKPNSDFPLSEVQIDHTELDVMLVDSKTRKFFKRPWITVVIDTFSRMVLGFYISFDPPSAYAVGRAIAHAILHKDKYLKMLELEDVEWPCWGKPTTIYCDNAKEFRGFMLKESCAQYKITLKWRPPRKPEMGGIIERYMGRIAEELKDIPGCTKRSKEMKEKFKPEKAAALTLGEFEKWFTLWVTEVYHKREHFGLGKMLPIEKWNEGIRGNINQTGIGLPEIVTNETKLRLDLLPQYTRTIQRTGVHILNFTYSADIIRRWVNAIDETAKGKVKPRRKFIFKMNPEDISSVMFLNPDTNTYCQVPTTINIKPYKMSIWDYRLAVADLKKNRKKPDASAIFLTYKRLIAIEEEAKAKTKNAKKNIEREIKIKLEKQLKAEESPMPSTDEVVFTVTKNEIKPYEELELSTRRSFK